MVLTWEPRAWRGQPFGVFRRRESGLCAAVVRKTGRQSCHSVVHMVCVTGDSQLHCSVGEIGSTLSLSSLPALWGFCVLPELLLQSSYSYGLPSSLPSLILSLQASHQVVQVCAAHPTKKWGNLKSGKRKLGSCSCRSQSSESQEYGPSDDAWPSSGLAWRSNPFSYFPVGLCAQLQSESILAHNESGEVISSLLLC